MKKTLKTIGIIPARMESSRFPGKPLIKILGLPMIEHVRRRAQQISSLDEVFVATCNPEIAKVVESFGGQVVMTSSRHERATDRVEEAVRDKDADIVVNIQGDEPMVTKESIDRIVMPLRENRDTLCTCAVYPLTDKNELSNYNIVKTVLSQSHRLLYLSRSPIPGNAFDSQTAYFKQSGFMAYRKDFLQTYQKLTPTPLEIKESCDALRILEHDYWIQGVVLEEATKGIDTPEQVKDVENAILSNPRQKLIYESIL